MEMPYALSFMAYKLVDEFSAVWHVINADYYYFLTAGWVHTLLTDKVFDWLDAKALKRMSKLDLHHMASGPGGQAMLDTFHKMHKATEVFPWTIVIKDVIRRDTQTRAACQVHVHLDSMAKYGFMLIPPCRGFACLPVGGGRSDDDGDRPVAAAQGNTGFVRQGTPAAGRLSRRASSPSRRSLSPVRETRVTAASGGHARPAQEDVWTSPEAFQAAVALFADGQSRRMDGQRVPCGVEAAALASAWNRQTEALRRAVRDAHGYVLEDAMPVLAQAMSVAADSAAAFDLLTQEVERLRQVAECRPRLCVLTRATSSAGVTAVTMRTRRSPRTVCAAAVRRWTGAAGGASATEAGGPRPVLARLVSLLRSACFSAGALRQVMLWRCSIHLARSWVAVVWTERVWLL